MTVNARIMVRPLRVVGFLLGGALVLVLASSLAKYLLFVRRVRYVMGVNLVELTNLGDEGNVPTWYSTALLLLACGVCWVVAANIRGEGGPSAAYWSGLSAILAAMSLDETASLHEKLPSVVSWLLRDPSIARVSWVAFAAPMAGMVVAAYLPFLRALPARTRWLFVLAGAIYTCGALGTEYLGQRWLLSEYGRKSLPYQLALGTEEAMEMVGVIVLIYALLDYIGRRWNHPPPSLMPEGQRTSDLHGVRKGQP
jgi:hypothetical protein